jgi:lysophospholipase L1-like esterase
VVGATVGSLILGTGVPAAMAARDAAQRPGDRQLMAVGLGDSVLTNQNCGCADLLADYGLLAGRRTGSDVEVRNEAKAGSTSDDLRKGMGDPGLLGELTQANVVVIFTGANDFFPAFGTVSGGGSVEKNYAPVALTVRRNVESVVAEVRKHNTRARIVVCGYWNDFKDGSVARHQYSAKQRTAADAATKYTNGALQQAADSSGVHYVSTRKLFQAERDVTPMLASDGDHLSAAGHRKIAQALVDLLHPADHPNADPAPAAEPQPAQPEPVPSAPLPPLLPGHEPPALSTDLTVGQSSRS